jgi:hypothetical protein
MLSLSAISDKNTPINVAPRALTLVIFGHIRPIWFKKVYPIPCQFCELTIYKQEVVLYNHKFFELHKRYRGNGCILSSTLWIYRPARTR